EVHDDDGERRVDREAKSGRAVAPLQRPAGCCSEGGDRWLARSFALLQAEVTWAQLVHQFENAPAAARHAGEGVVRHHHRQTGLFRGSLSMSRSSAPPPVSTMPR